MHALYLSINKSYRPGMTMREVAECARRAWCITTKKAKRCEVVVALVGGRPIAAWQLADAYPDDEKYSTSGGLRSKTALVLGDPVPLEQRFFDTSLTKRRQGVATGIV